MKPSLKPNSANFSSGPCAKRPGYNVANLDVSALGRSHRSIVGKDLLKRVCEETSSVLGLPDDYRVGVVPASDTGAFEMAMWSMLGERPVDLCAWESFGKGWINDAVNQLKLSEISLFEADYGDLPKLELTNSDNDIVFTWNGTTSGVKVPDSDWIDSNRRGLTFCDATSAVFAMDMPWDKLDVTTFSWQKVLGGEGAHGMLILSPRAVERLETYTPSWPLPKLFRLTKSGKLIDGIFSGQTINTPSLLCAADYLDALEWVRSLGGINAAIKKSEDNLSVIKAFVDEREWIGFLANKIETLSNTSVCLKLDLSAEKVKQMTKLLESEQVAFDIGSYRDAPAGLRIWCGATVEQEDLILLMPWLDWAFEKIK